MRGALAIGVVVVAVHAAAFVALAQRASGTDRELAIDVTSAPAAPTLAITARIPPAIAARVTTDDDDGAPPGAGLHRRRWSIAYRGGFQRAVGAAQLVGPFQDPAAPACTGRVIVGQRLLDDGHAGRGTIAGVIARELDAELRGEGYFPVGDYQRVTGLAVRWAELSAHPDDRIMLGFAGAPHGYVRATATIAFERVDIPIVVTLVPTLGAGALHFRIAARAELAFDNRVAQWVSKHIGGDKLATRLARRELDGTLLDALAPPPAFALPGGAMLRFDFCNEPPEIVDGKYAALPFAVDFGTLVTAPSVRPPRLGRGPFAPVAADTRVAIDLDLDALNALLFELWRTSTLDQQLADAGLDRKFNADPTVTELLSTRLSPLRLALPPVVVAVGDARGDHLRLSAEDRLAIGDGADITTGRIWSGLDFRFGPTAAAAPAVDLGALELSCERTPTTLVPCYADLVAALRGRSADAHGALTAAFTQLLAAIFVDRRLAADALPAALVIHGATPTLTVAAPTATLRLTLDAALAP